MSRKTGTILDFQGDGDVDHEAPAFNPNWRAAEVDAGVAYICPWEDPYSGFPEHARRCARALDSAGLPVHLRSIDPTIQWHMHFEVGGKDKTTLRKRYEDLLDRTIKRYMVEIYQVVPDDTLLQRLTTHRFVDPKDLVMINRFRIISCVFERDRVSAHAVRAMNQVGQIWVANYKDQLMLEDCGVERVAVVPIPHFPDDPMLQLRGRQRAPGPVRFYHIGKWEHRKAHHEMIGAFLTAFKPGDAKFYFKTSTTAPDFGDYPSSIEASVHRWMEDTEVQLHGWTPTLASQDIFPIKQRMPQDGIVRLHRHGDIYVSLSRGEGFDMPAYDAVLAGNLLVYTPSGGPQSFASSDDIFVPMSSKIEAHPFYRWGDAQYGDWDRHEAAAALRAARDRVRNGEAHEARDVSEFSAAFVGAYMRRLVEDVVAEAQRFCASVAPKQNDDRSVR